MALPLAAAGLPVTDLPANDLNLRADIRQVIADFAAGQGVAAERVDALLVRLFRYQFAHIAAYRAFCIGQGVADVQDWRQIPCAPAELWKYAPMATAAAIAEPAAVFETSGTTDGRPGRAHLRSTDLYDAAARATFDHFVLPDRATTRQFRCISLVPSLRDRPRSSLGHMVHVLAAQFGDGALFADPQELPQVCKDLASQPTPVLIFATTLALGVACERWPADVRVRLPAGSRLMDTGGSKGRTQTLDRPQLHAWLAEALGIDGDFLVGEYGMTELSSQRYETTLRGRALGFAGTRAYAGPPWLRTRILRADGRGLPSQDCADGETGLAAHLDLACVDSCAFLQTADWASSDAQGSIVLHGRLLGAELRGCGLDSELWQ